jgi:Sulfotransferase family
VTAEGTPASISAPPAAPRRLVFVAGLHRSGTSLIHRCLAAHPDVSGFTGTGVPEDEGQHLQTVYPPDYLYGGAGLFGFAPEMHLTEASPLARPENRERLLREWGAHWRPGAAVGIEKSPPNLVRTRFLQALFPDAAFVVVLRHPIAVAGATRKGRRMRLSYRSLVHHWVACHETLAADATHVRALHLVRYERFVADPDGELAHLQVALGLEPHPSGERVRTDANERYLARWRSRLNPHRALDRRRTVARFEADVRRFGYSLVDLGLVGRGPLPPPPTGG